jgi:hypothetical protein
MAVRGFEAGTGAAALLLRFAERGGLRRRSAECACVIAMLAGPAAQAHAADAAPTPAAAATLPPAGSAAEHFAAGERAYARGDYLQSAAEFRQAYLTAAHPASLWNQARALHRAREDARAATCYRAYLDTAPADSADRDAATRALAELSSTLGRADIQLEPDTKAYLDGATEPELFLTIYLAPGQHRVVARSGDNEIRASADIHSEAGKVRAVLLTRSAPQPGAQGGPEVQLSQVGAGTAGVASGVPALPLRVPSTDGSTLPESPKSSLRQLPPWVLAPLGAATIGIFTGAGLTGAATMRAQSRYLDSRSTVDFEAGKNLQSNTNWYLGIGIGVAAITTLVAAVFVDYASTPNKHTALRRRNLQLESAGVRW